MSKILITGNGFDLFHHLPTKYNHFMAVMRTIEENNFHHKVPFDELFGKTFKEKHLSDYNCILENYNTKKIIFNVKDIKEIKDKIENNIWFKYFKTVEGINTWIDFENDIFDALSEVDEFIKEGKTVINSISDISKIHILLSNICSIESNRIFYDLEYVRNKKNKIGQVTTNNINEEKIFIELSNSLNDFIIIFNRYFVDIVNPFYDNRTNKELAYLSKIDKIYTFNYTPTLEKIYKIDSLKVVYLHGKVNSINEKQNIILGINDVPEFLKKINIFDFEKSFQKIIKKTNFKFIDTSEKSKYQTSQTIFYLFGHSLDRSDKVYLEDLFKYLETDKSEESKICIFYYDLKDMNKKLRNIFGIIGREKIEEMNKNERLYFTELCDENIEKELNRELNPLREEFKIQVR